MGRDITAAFLKCHQMKVDPVGTSRKGAGLEQQQQQQGLGQRHTLCTVLDPWRVWGTHTGSKGSKEQIPSEKPRDSTAKINGTFQESAMAGEN